MRLQLQDLLVLTHLDEVLPQEALSVVGQVLRPEVAGEVEDAQAVGGVHVVRHVLLTAAEDVVHLQEEGGDGDALHVGVGEGELGAVHVVEEHAQALGWSVAEKDLLVGALTQAAGEHHAEVRAEGGEDDPVAGEADALGHQDHVGQVLCLPHLPQLVQQHQPMFGGLIHVP